MNHETNKQQSHDIKESQINKNGRNKLTHDEFIKRVADRHPNITIVGNYSGALSVVHCRCDICGFEWTPFPETLYKGKGCPRCHHRSRNGSEKFFTKMSTDYPTINISGEYVNQSTHLHCECSICGCEWDATPNTLLKGKGCIKCSGNYHRTQEELIEELSEINPTVEIVGNYTNTSTSVSCKCKLCGYSWNATPAHLLEGKACPECAKTKIANALSKSHDEFIEDMQRIHPTIKIVGTYKNRTTRIECYCTKCGTEWAPVASDLYYLSDCPKCAIKIRAASQRKSHQQFINELSTINPHIRVLNQYTSRKGRIECQCDNCQHIWTTSANSLLCGRGCPNCSHAQTSFFERFLLLVCKRVFGDKNVLSRNRSVIGRELDIYIPSIGIAIEPGNWHWHKLKVDYDREKYCLCKNIGIQLITIYDNFDDDVDKIGINCDDFITYPNSLQKENEFVDAAVDIFSKLKLQYDLSADDFHQLYVEARRSVNKVTTVKIINQLKDTNPNIELLGQYEGDKIPILCRCTKCGHEWKRTAYSLLNKHKNCPICGGRKKRVINLDTGDIFESVSSASKYFGVTASSLRGSCNRPNGLCKGNHVAYVNNVSKEKIDELRLKYPEKFKEKDV